MTPLSFLTDRVAVLATKHHKEQAIAPLLHRQFNLQVIVPPEFDTDAFGTFTREVKRLGTQIEAARLKAKKAMSLTGETLALASEGTFGPHPAIPYIPHNREIILLLDTANDLEIIAEEVSTETNYAHQLVSTPEQAYSFAQSVGFPDHALVVIVGDAARGDGEIIKGITTEEQLFEAVEFARKRSSDGRVHLETDMRAMYNPTRMKAIAKATENLIQKLHQFCPQCSWPGFDAIARQPGLPCQLCQLPTPLTRSLIYHCQKCGLREEKLCPDGRQTADPTYCHYCNP
jgi:hypothetical protein